MDKSVGLEADNYLAWRLCKSLEERSSIVQDQMSCQDGM
jgi:hypothetical protein